MNIGRLLRTVRHLQAQQVFYRLYYPLKKWWWRPRRTLPAEQMTRALALRSEHPFHQQNPDVWISHSNGFALLNKRTDFADGIDWAFQGHGLLWAYHLHYFNYLRNEDVDPGEARSLMHDYLRRAGPLRHAPYPTSLRIINWTAFALRYGIDEVIAAGLFEDAQRLAAFPEYQIGANHLLTNGFGLFHAALFFHDKKLTRAATATLGKALGCRLLNDRGDFWSKSKGCQIQRDGGHFERSPGYHALLLDQFLSCIAMARHTPVDLMPLSLLRRMERGAGYMLGWLEKITNARTPLPVFGDMNAESSPERSTLCRTAKAVRIWAAPSRLDESAYRMLSHGALDVVVNVGPPAPAHQPGHSHADPLSFAVYCDGSPVITHHGCSTYERGPARDLERSTRMHNCITPEDIGQNAAELWAAFRMGRRPVVEILEDGFGRIVEARHDGYRRAGFLHRRRWEVQEGGFLISDFLEGKAIRAVSHLHFHPEHPPRLVAPYVVEAGGLRIVFRHYKAVHLRSCRHADGFHKTRPAICIQGEVANQSALIITPTTACS